VSEAEIRAAAIASSPLAAFQRQRKLDSRARLVDAAIDLFGRHGYPAVSVEDVATEAGVSRMTFYRHFRGKADLAVTLFSQNVAQAGPKLLSIGSRDWTDRNVVKQWLTELFAADRANRKLLRVFIQASAIEPEFTKQGHAQIAQWIEELGRSIPAFALEQDNLDHRRRWLEAWLLLFELLDQSNHAALDSGIAADPLMIELLGDRFLQFVLAKPAC
jgi:AcrR family transcriptional regulator